MRLRETRPLDLADFIEQKTRGALDERHYIFVPHIAPESRRDKNGMTIYRRWALWRDRMMGFYRAQFAAPHPVIRRYQMLAMLSYNHRGNCSYAYIGLPRLHEKFQQFETRLR